MSRPNVFFLKACLFLALLHLVTGSLSAQTRIDSVDQLVQAMSESNGNYKMEPGTYTISKIHRKEHARRPIDSGLPLYGSNNTFDLTGAKFILPMEVMRTQGRSGTVQLLVWGDDNTVRGGEFEVALENEEWNVEQNSDVLKFDFVAYNNDKNNRHPGQQARGFQILGHRNKMIDNQLITRGSYPYGYGEIYGKGQHRVFGLHKQSGVLINGDDTLIKGLDLRIQTYGHGIFIQGGSNTTVRDSHIEGVMRLGQAMYDDGPESIAAKYKFRQFYELWRAGPIDREKAYPLCEDGLRAYGNGIGKDGKRHKTGAFHVFDTTVKNTRSGLACLNFPKTTIERVKCLGNSSGFNISGGGDIVDCQADAAYGPVVQAQTARGGKRTIDIEILDAPHATGSHPLAEIAGSEHTYNFTSNVEEPKNVREIWVGYAWDRWESDDKKNRAKGQVINNDTRYPVVFKSQATQTKGYSRGAVSGKVEQNPDFEMR